MKSSRQQIHSQRSGRARTVVSLLAALTLTPLVAGAEEGGSDGIMDNGDQTAAHFAALDADHDGYVTKAEAAKEPSLDFATLLKVGDANHDGRLNRGEFESAVNEIATEGPGATQGEEQPEALFIQWDQNRDDRLTLDEVPADRRPELQRILDALGRKSGGVTFEEFVGHFGKASSAPAAAAPDTAPTVPAAK